MTAATTPNQTWLAVRCVVHHRDLGVYEERITLRRPASFGEAIRLAEHEARDYAGGLKAASYAGLAQAYELDDEPDHGAELFSLMRESTLPTAEYLNAFFDTSSERQQDGQK